MAPILRAFSVPSGAAAAPKTSRGRRGRAEGAARGMAEHPASTYVIGGSSAVGAQPPWRLREPEAGAPPARCCRGLLSAQLIIHMLTVHDRRAGEAIFWAELRHWTTGGISPPQLCLTVRAECLRGAMSDRLRARPAAPTTCTRPPPQSAACEPITPTEPGRPELFELGAPRRCVRPARALRRQVLEPRRIHSSFLGRQRELAPHVLAGCSASWVLPRRAGSQAEGQG